MFNKKKLQIVNGIWKTFTNFAFKYVLKFLIF